jgi:hypothetical protein
MAPFSVRPFGFPEVRPFDPGVRRRWPPRRGAGADAADEVPAVHFAEWIERDETAGMRGCGRVVAGRILLLHHPLKRLYRPAPQRLFAKEGQLVELRAVAGREAGKKITQIEAAGPLELAAVAGLLEQLRIDLQVDRKAPKRS